MLFWLTTKQRDALYELISFGTLEDLNKAQTMMFSAYHSFALKKDIFCPSVYLAQEVMYHISDLRFVELTPERRRFLQGECLNKIQTLHKWA